MILRRPWIRDVFLPASSGLLLLLCFPTFPFSFLAFFAWVPLLVSLEGKGPRRRFQSGWIAGVVFFAFLVYWLNTVTRTGYCLLVLYLSLYPAVFCMLLGRLRGPFARPLWGGLIWAELEYLRSIGPLSFSWGLLGHTQWSIPQLTHSAGWWGVYGLSFLLMAANLCLAEIWLSRREKRRARNAWIWPLALLAIVAVVGGPTGETPESSRRFRVALVQGNYPQDDKWAVSVGDTLDRYLGLSDAAAAERPNLIIWPETAIPDVLTQRPPLRMEIDRWVEAHGIPLLLGAVSSEGTGAGYYNSAFLVSPSGQEGTTWNRYDKNHLVPWGEMVPLGRFFPFIEKMVEDQGGGDYLPGKVLPVFEVDGVHFGVLICFESTLATLAREYARQDVDMLVVITNDAWFGPSTAPYQHAIQSSFRAVECGVPVVRATNTGWTSAFDRRGRLIRSLPIYEPGLLIVDVEVGRRHPTLSTRWGDLPIQIAIGVTLGFFAIGFLFPQRRPGSRKN